MGIDYSVVWDTIESDLPILEKKIKDIVKKM